MKFKNVEDVRRYLKDQANLARENEQLVNKSVKLLSKLEAVSFEIMDISGKPTKKKTLNVDFPVVKVPGLSKLEKDYKLAETLSERYKDLVVHENQVKLNFKDIKGDKLNELLGAFTKLKSQIEIQLKTLFTSLSNLAEGHAPKEYKTFVKNLALSVEEHIEFDSAKTMTYISLNEGQLVFTSYIMLVNAISDEDKVVPHLYLILQWTVDGDVSVFVEHDFVAPSLLTGGSTVDNLQQAMRAVKYQLSLSEFSSQIGSLPVSMQLKTKGPLGKELFSPRDNISRIDVEEHEITFVLKPGLNKAEKEQIKAQLFQEVKALLKNQKQAKIRMRESGNKIVFEIVNLDHSKGIHPYDLEHLKNKYGLKENDLRKIVNIINGE